MRTWRGETTNLSQLSAIIACEDDLEEALHFLVRALDTKPKRGKKPVVVHSLRVAMTLGHLGCNANVMVAGLLHDILEKTALPAGQITRRFGSAVSAMVQATTNNMRIDDSLGRYYDSLQRCAKVGEGALLVRGADLLDNCDRLLALGSYDRLQRIGAKLFMLIQVSRESKVDGRMVGELARRYRRIGRKVGGLALVAKKANATAKAARLASHHG